MPYALVVQKGNDRFVYAGDLAVEGDKVSLTKAKIIVSSRYPADVVASGIGFSKIQPAYLSITKEVKQVIIEAKTIVFPDKKTQTMIESHKDTGNEYFYEKEDLTKKK